MIDAHTLQPFLGITTIIIVSFGLMARWRRSGPLTVGMGGLLGFSTAFAVEAGFYDNTGLWGVGYLILITGTGCGLFLISLCVALARTPQQGRPRP